MMVSKESIAEKNTEKSSEKVRTKSPNLNLINENEKEN
jgi:hypothetical protein